MEVLTHFLSVSLRPLLRILLSQPLARYPVAASAGPRNIKLVETQAILRLKLL